MLNIAKRAAYAVQPYIMAQFEQLNRLEIRAKADNDFVSNVDIAVEQELVKIIRAAYPKHRIIAEEEQSLDNLGDNSEKKNSGSAYCWVIDPIDGTTNFIKGLPHFAVSIALLKNNKPEIGVVYQPITDELFAAAKGQGATLNDRRIRVANTLPENAIIATGIPFRHPDTMPKQIRCLQNVLANFPDIRRAGAASLDLCYAACGRVDGYYEFGLSAWDIAAGALIAQESGAIVSDTDGDFNYLDNGNIVAAPAKVYKQLIKITRNKD